MNKTYIEIHFQTSERSKYCVNFEFQFYVRTYARAIAGVPTSMSFDHYTLDFSLNFTVDPTISEPTEVYVPSLRYTNGYTITTSPNLVVETMDDFVLLHYTSGETEAQVTIVAD